MAKLEGRLGKPVPTTYCACYEYERREGCSHVAGDEQEDGVDDLEGEFGLQDGGAGHDDDPQYVAKSMLRVQMSYDHGGGHASRLQPRPECAAPHQRPDGTHLLLSSSSAACVWLKSAG